MAVHLVMQAFILLLACELPEATPPIAKPNCKSRCGNLQIPYPFGIGPDCYLDKWFEIVCKGTGGSAQAFLTSIGKEVRQIIISNNPSTNNFIESTVQVQVRPIYSKHCKYAGNHSIVNITGSPFHFSHYHNTFISVGCDNIAIIDNIFPKVFGCESDCKKDMKVDKEVKCSGFNCCESTNIPSNLQTFDVKFRSINKSNDKDDGIKHCKYAFLADKGWLEKSKRDPSSVQYWEYVPVVLEWAIFLRNNNSHELFHFLEGRRQVNCSRSYENKDHLYSFSCRCAPGYEGNPYVDGGCEDINECEDDLLNYCKNKLDCENTEGGYNCEKRKSKLKMVIVGFGTSLGVLFLPTTWVLYKLIKKKNNIKLKKKFFKKNGGLLLQQQLSSTKNNVQNTKLFNSKEIEKATDHFSKDRIIGKGGQGQFTEKSDVYSFGVVLVELLTGEKPVSSTRSEEEGDKEDIIIVANLAKKCLHLNGKERPTMGEVAIELQGIQKKDTNGQENYEELHNVRSKEIDPSYACSTSTQSYSEIASSSSSIVLPSSSFKSL
ncbi:hypothetical protein CMV_020758 [Castanea mollissima]|uniref:Uncharacterized protein n=1 Tax=Castanea mollissima TaxID=60419 RepID=A0A8J4VMD4_9ROSI|nr:hypothetical protein CMV_020758 [Castanea mollissima]